MMKKGIASFALLLPVWCFGDLSLIQKSDPAGLFSQSTHYFDHNDTFLTRAVPERTGSYAFTHWEINGNRTSVPNISVALQVSGKITENTQAVAKYSDINLDSDRDGIKDWYEIRTKGSISSPIGLDDDNDSIPFAKEYEFGLNPNAKNTIHEGGISIRRASKVFVNLGGARKLQVQSDPAGLIASTSAYPEVNSTYNSQNLNGLQNGYYFSHWEVNGIRKSDASGKGLSKISEIMDQDKEIVARFIKQDLDSDNDKIPDWYEWHEFGTLNLNNQSNPDEDLFTLENERKYGLNGNIEDRIQEGGISIRRSGPTKMNLGGGSFVKITSDPPGMVNSAFLLQEKNSTYQSPSLNGKNGNFVFSHWEINGIRQAGPSGIALSRVIERLDTDKTIIAKYFEESIDIDEDGILDAYEMQQFGGLALSGNSDPDNDGFDNYQEINFGLSPIIHDRLLEGGISLRRAKMVNYATDVVTIIDSDGDGLSDQEEATLGSNINLTDTDGDGYSDHQEYLAGSNLTNANSFPNQSPNAIHLSNDEVLENKPIGTIVGSFSVSDPNPQSVHQIKLLEQNNSESQTPFFIDENNTLRTGTMFDFEKNQSFEISVLAVDEGNLSMQKSFTIKITNLVEDLDEDGIEDAFDNDIDGDGFSNEEEISYGSDPGDPNSISNSPPANITLSNHIIYENQSPGSLIGKVSADDSDANTTLRFSIFDHNGSNAINSTYFIIDPNGSVRSSIVFDYEEKSKYEILIVALDDYNASSESNFTIQISNEIEDLDQDGIEDALDTDIDGDGFSNDQETANGSNPNDAKSVPNSPPTQIVLINANLSENLPIGTVVGNFIGFDPDPDSSLSYLLADGNGSTNNWQFKLDKNGTLITKFTFDYESQSSVSLRVRLSDESNESMEKAFTLEVVDVFEEKYDKLPLVITQKASERDNSEIQLKGEIIKTGDFKIREVGFVLLNAESDQSRMLVADLNRSNMKFGMVINEFAFGKNNHFQAYAKTEFGTSYGSIKTFKLDYKNQKDLWWSGLSDFTVNGWITESWMGTLLPYENQWAFHQRLEWVYLRGDGKNGFWIWKENFGWLWSNPSSWPFMWSHQSSNWFYLLPQSSSYLLYDYSTETLR